MARVQVSDLSQERITPTAAPVNTFSRPATGGQDLLRALSSLSPVLGKMADRKAQEEKEAQEALVERKIGGMTFEEFKAEKAKDPSLGFTSPWAKAALDRQWGARLGNEVRRQAEEELATSDLTAVDPEHFVAQKVREAQAELPDSKHAIGGFTAATEGLVDKVRDRVNADRAKRTVEARGDTVFANMLSDVERAVEDGVSPDTMLGTFRSNMQSNRDLLSMSYAEQDKLVMRLIQTVSQKPGMEAWVEMLGSLDRDNGVSVRSKMGPIYEAAQEAAKAATLKADNEKAQPELQDWLLRARSGDPEQFGEQAFNTWADQHPWMTGAQRASIIDSFRSAQEAQLRAKQAELEAHAKDQVLLGLTPQLTDLARIGKVAEITDFRTVVGTKEVSFSREELKEFALKEGARQEEAEAARQGRDPRRARLDFYARNGEVDPLLEQRVHAFLRSNGIPGDVPQTALDYLPEVLTAMEVTPQMVRQIAPGEEDRLFLETLFTAADLGMSPQEALRQANFVRSSKDQLTLPRGKELKEHVDAAFSRAGHPSADRVLLDKTIERRVLFFAAAGAKGNTLTQKVADSINRDHVFLNGRYIDITGTGVTPAVALPAFQEAAEALKEAQPDYRKMDISFVPMGPGSSQYQAVAAGGVPIPGAVRTWREIWDLKQRRRTAKLQQRGERAASFRQHQVERWSSENAGAGPPGSMIEPIR